MGRDEVSVGNIPMINGELPAIRRTIPNIEFAGGDATGIMEIAASPK